MARIKTKKNAVLFKYGSVPTTADVVDIEEFVNIAPDIKSQEYKRYDGKLGATQSYIDKHHTTCSLSIQSQLRGNNKEADALGTPPKIDNLLKASGLKSIVLKDDDDNDIGIEYTVNHSALVPSVAKVYVDGKLREANNIVGNFKLSGEIGSVAKVNFDMQGYTTITETSSTNPDVSLDNEALLILDKISAVSIDGSTTFELKSFNLDLGNDIQDVYVVGAGGFDRVDFDAKLSLTGLKSNIDDSWEKLSAQDIITVSITLGTTTGQKVIIECDGLIPTAVSESDDSGNLSITKEFRLTNKGTSGEHLKIRWI